MIDLLNLLWFIAGVVVLWFLSVVLGIVWGEFLMWAFKKLHDGRNA